MSFLDSLERASFRVPTRDLINIGYYEPDKVSSLRRGRTLAFFRESEYAYQLLEFEQSTGQSTTGARASDITVRRKHLYRQTARLSQP